MKWPRSGRRPPFLKPPEFIVEGAKGAKNSPEPVEHGFGDLVGRQERVANRKVRRHGVRAPVEAVLNLQDFVVQGEVQRFSTTREVSVNAAPRNKGAECAIRCMRTSCQWSVGQ